MSRKPDHGLVYNDEIFLTQTNHHDSVKTDKHAAVVRSEKNARRRAARLEKFLVKSSVSTVKPLSLKPEYYETKGEIVKRESKQAYAAAHKELLVKPCFEDQRDKRIELAKARRVNEIDRSCKNLKKTVKSLKKSIKILDEEIDDVLRKKNDVFGFESGGLWGPEPDFVERDVYFEDTDIVIGKEIIPVAGKTIAAEIIPNKITNVQDEVFDEFDHIQPENESLVESETSGLDALHEEIFMQGLPIANHEIEDFVMSHELINYFDCDLSTNTFTEEILNTDKPFVCVTLNDEQMMICDKFRYDSCLNLNQNYPNTDMLVANSITDCRDFEGYAIELVYALNCSEIDLLRSFHFLQKNLWKAKGFDPEWDHLELTTHSIIMDMILMGNWTEARVTYGRFSMNLIHALKFEIMKFEKVFSIYFPMIDSEAESLLTLYNVEGSTIAFSEDIKANFRYARNFIFAEMRDFVIYARSRLQYVSLYSQMERYIVYGRGTMDNSKYYIAKTNVVHPDMPFVAWSSLIHRVVIFMLGPTNLHQKVYMVNSFIIDQLGLSIVDDVIFNANINNLLSTFVKNIEPNLTSILLSLQDYFESFTGVKRDVNTIAFTDNLETITHPSLFKMLGDWIKQVFAFLCTIQVVENSLVDRIKSFISSIISYSSFGELIKSTLDVLKNLFERGMMWWNTGDWNDFFLYDRVSSWYGSASELIRVASKLNKQVMSVDQQSLLLQQLTDHLKVGKKIISVRGLRDKTYFAITGLVNNLDKAILEVSQSRTANQPHAQPFVVQVYAESAVGKSSVVFAAATEFMRSDGRVGDQLNSGAIYNVNIRDEYDSQLKIGQDGFFADEVGSLKCQFDDGAMLMRLMAICNIMPTLANMADLESKGVNYLHFKWGFVTSNFQDCRAHDFMNNPYAFLRRMEILLTVVIHPDYRKEYSADANVKGFTLDKEKLTNEGKDIIEVQLWKVQMRKVINNRIIIEDYEPEQHNIEIDNVRYVKATKGLQMLVQLYERHKVMQSLVVNNTSSYFTREVCNTCKRLFCVCENQTISYEMLPYYAFILLTLSIIGDYFMHKFFTYTHTLKTEIEEDLKLVPDLMIDGFIRRMAVDKQRIRKIALGVIGSSTLLLTLVTLFRSKYKEVKTNTIYSVKLQNVDYEVEASKSFPYKYPISSVRNEPQRILHVNNALIPSDATTPERLYKLVRRATYVINFIPTEGNPTIATGFFLFGHYFITVRHLLQGKTNGTFILSNSCHTLKPFVFNEQQVLVIAQDIILIFVQSAAPYADLRKYLYKSTGEQNLNIPDGKLIGFQNELKEMNNNQRIELDNEATNFRVEILEAKGEDGSFYEQGVCAKLKAPAVPGNSGSPVVNCEAIIGITGITIKDSHCGIFIIPSSLVQDEALQKFLPEIFMPNLEPNVISADLQYHTSERTILNHFIGPDSPMLYLGTLKGYRFNPSKSNLRKSLIYSDVVCKMRGEVPIPGIPHYRVIEENGKFMFQDPMNTAFCELATIQGIEPSLSIALMCYFDYVRPIFELPFDEEKAGGPLSLHEALNSAVPFSRLPVNTAAGIGLGRKKKDYLNQRMDGTYEFKSEILERFKKFCQDFCDGKERPILSATVKDELRKVLKVVNAAERVFCASPFFFTVICRMYLMPVLVFIMDHHLLFEHAVGINAMSVDWESLYYFLRTHKFNLAGDFKHFDQSHLRVFMKLFVTMCSNIAHRYLHYSEFDMTMLLRILTCCIYYIVSVKGDIVEPSQGVGSGLPITVFINCFMASMYIRLAWYTQMMNGNLIGEFRDKNKLITFGDDHILNTSEKLFGFKIIRDTLSIYGITYTPADKSDNEFDFQPFETITFLKRGFVETTYNGRKYIMCPLEWDSIYKSLLYVKCDVNQEKHQIAQNIVDAHKQFFFWGIDIFRRECLFLQDLAEKNNINIEAEGSQATLRWYTYDELFEQYMSKKLVLAFV